MCNNEIKAYTWDIRSTAHESIHLILTALWTVGKWVPFYQNYNYFCCYPPYFREWESKTQRNEGQPRRPSCSGNVGYVSPWK